MLITVAVAIAVAALMLAAVRAMKRRRGDDRGDLLVPPGGLGTKAGARAPRAPPPRDGWPDGAAPIGDLPDHVAEEARQLLAGNRKIEAVKLVRAATGCSLEEAVDRVERL